jgi:hypothetical protein
MQPVASLYIVVNTEIDIYLRVCHVYATNDDMNENRKMISIRLPPELLEDLDAYRAEHDFPPQRTAVIVEAVRRFLAQQRAAKTAPKKK